LWAHALQFDSSDMDGVIEDLDRLLKDFLDKSAKASVDYLDVGEGGDANERQERLDYGWFLKPESRKAFYDTCKEIENISKILSPSNELVDQIRTFKRLVQVYLQQCHLPEPPPRQPWYVPTPSCVQVMESVIY
jgi:type I restriction enzyme R subunit